MEGINHKLRSRTFKINHTQTIYLFLCLAHHCMTITLENAGKRFNREWIFRHVSHVFESGKTYAITGPNGSGKSTLLQALAGSLGISEGTCTLRVHQQTVPEQEVYKQVSLAAPYLELVEEMTATELLKFHAAFKPLIAGITREEILSLVGLGNAANKQIRYYSSGMKQRLKLAQAFFSDTPVLLLDEPCTNLDAPGYQLYYELVNKYAAGKLLIVCSNDKNEYSFCSDTLNIMDYK